MDDEEIQSDVDPEEEERLDIEQGKNFVWCEPCQSVHVSDCILRAELDTLRAGVASWKAEEEAWKQREAELLAQVATIRDVKEQCARQRDTLADLLARIWDSVPAESSGPSVERHAAVLNEIPTALLRKAGRL